MRLIPTPPGEIVSGSVRIEGTDLLKLDEATMREMRGGKIAMIFQEPMTALNPLLTIGRQIAEMVVVHDKVSRRAARDRQRGFRLAAVHGKFQRLFSGEVHEAILSRFTSCA